MPKAASIHLTPSANPLAVPSGVINLLLMTYACLAIRSGDLPYFGL